MKHFIFSILFLFLSTSNAKALDFGALVDKVKNEVTSFFSKKDKVVAPKISMPVIPEVTENATSVSVYNRKGKLISQGESFNKLTLEEKRKYRIAFIKELYFVVRDSEPKKEEILTSLNALEQNGTREGIYRSLVLDRVYASLEGYEDGPSTKLVNFSVYFGRKYLGREFSKEIIQKLNLWGIKRVLVEKTLEVMDSFNTDGVDFYKWYALLSEELSSKFETVWQSKARRDKRVEFHYRWVQSVPFQQIKSEVIIKLHKLMNQLNSEE